MPAWLSVIVVAIGGAMLLEGAVYALFPAAMKRAMREMQSLPDGALRVGGLAAGVIGLAIVYFMLPKA